MIELTLEVLIFGPMVMMCKKFCTSLSFFQDLLRVLYRIQKVNVKTPHGYDLEPCWQNS